MKRIALWTMLMLFGCVAGTPASAASPAKVEGGGSISTNLGFPYTQIDTEYENPVFLDVANSVQLPQSLIGSGSKLLELRGQAQFGRLGVRSFIGGQVPQSPNLSTGVDVFMGFEDLITPQNLNPLSANFLRLDVELSGDMAGFGATDNGNTIGKLTSANFGITMLSLDHTSFRRVSGITFSWFGDNFFIFDGTQNVAPPFGFEWYAGEEPSFTPGALGYLFGARGYVDIPLDDVAADFGGDPFLFGEPFLLSVAASASSSCGNEIPSCLAVTDFGNTALIGNARIVNQNGVLVPNALFASASGYDYITPPGPITTAIPEPETYAMLLAGLGLLGFIARRRKNKLR